MENSTGAALNEAIDRVADWLTLHVFPWEAPHMRSGTNRRSGHCLRSMLARCAAIRHTGVYRSPDPKLRERLVAQLAASKTAFPA